MFLIELHAIQNCLLYLKYFRVENPSTDVLSKKVKLATHRPSSYDTDSGASTSGTTKNENRPRSEPLSEFYQSLLESSYTDDGSE